MQSEQAGDLEEVKEIPLVPPAHGQLTPLATADRDPQNPKTWSQLSITAAMSISSKRLRPILFPFYVSKRRCIFDGLRTAVSSFLLVLSITAVLYAIAKNATIFPDVFPAYAQYILLFFCLIILAITEGLHVAVVYMAKQQPHNYEPNYPRCSEIIRHVNGTRNRLERFLMGRQVIVVAMVFILGRITTFDDFYLSVPNALISALMYSGFLGVILTVIVGQLTPQILATCYPAVFLDLRIVTAFYYLCLAIETSGLVHATLVLCWAIRKLTIWGRRVCGCVNFCPDLQTEETIPIGVDVNIGDDSVTETTPLRSGQKSGSPSASSDLLVENQRLKDEIQQLKQRLSVHNDL